MPYMVLRTVICMTTINILLFSTTLYGGTKKMEPLYDLNKTEKWTPVEYKLRRELSHLIPVPRDNALGTNDMNNAITLIKFNKDRLVFEEVARDFLKYVSGGAMSILPVFHSDIIGYTQTRGFLLFNLRTKEFTDYRICPSIEESITKAAVADVQKRHFLFEVQKFPKNSDGSGRDFTMFLRLIDLSGKEEKLIKEIKLDPGVDWLVFSGKIFMFLENRMQVYTGNFGPAYHPLRDLFMRNKSKIDAVRINIHPTLPFAIISGGKYDSMLVSWDKGGRRGDLLVNLFNHDTEDFSISPDGKWMVFKRYVPGGGTNYHTFLAPISEKYPNFIGSPIKLFDKFFEDYENNWTKNPTSLVGAYLDKLYRWELTSEAHKESTKPDFHEFIVEKDLEKLTKEKKQGLGQDKK